MRAARRTGSNGALAALNTKATSVPRRHRCATDSPVWLSVSVEETVRRLRTDTIDRPFRDHPDPGGMIAAMLAEREPLYRLADLRVPADGRTAEQVAFEIEQVVRTRRQL